VINTLQTQTQK